MEKLLSGPGGNSGPALAFAHGFVTGIFLILMNDSKRTVRFHAIQRILVSPALVVVVFVLSFVSLAGPFIPDIQLTGPALLFGLRGTAYTGRKAEIPLIGPVAEPWI